MKIGIFYDSLISIGGAERVMIDLANRLNADLVVSGFNNDLRKETRIECDIIDIGNYSWKFSRTFSYLLEVPFRFFITKRKFDYDLYIFSGVSSIFGSIDKNNNLWFSHTPNRLIYDLSNYENKNSNLIRKLVIKAYSKFFLRKDQKCVIQNMKKIIVNSKNVKKRVKEYYDKNSIVIYPPIKTEDFRFNKFGDFYLAVSRLFPTKRMDLIARAFAKMPNKKLTLVGDGPEKNKILDIIKDSPNIKLLDRVDDKELINLYSNCLATIYMPVDEDFGLVPLEGMASGKPCIAVNEGGCKETVLPDRTGFLIKATEKEIIKTVKTLDKNRAKKMKLDCINQAKKFDIEECIKKWSKIVNETKTKIKH